MTAEELDPLIHVPLEMLEIAHSGLKVRNLTQLAAQLDGDGYRPGRLWAPLISLTELNKMLRGMLMPDGGLAMRSKVAFTSSAVSSAPSWNSTPLRRKNV